MKKVFIITTSVVFAAIAVLLVYKIFTNMVFAPSSADTKTAPRQPPSETGDAFMLAAKYEEAGELVKARDAYKGIIEKFPGSKDIAKAEESLGDTNLKILYSPDIMEGKSIYEVQEGDTLGKIAKRYNVTMDLIAKINSLKNNVVRLGAKIRVPDAKFSIVIDKSQNILTLKNNGDILKTYRVATGAGDSTPTGEFTIVNKVANPSWYPPTGGVVPSGDPRNILGSRWLGLSKKNYGIHGTTDPQSIVRQVTEGCVRLKNSDVEELYMIVPEGTEVIITD